MNAAKRIFDQAIDLPMAEREGFVENACAGSPVLRNEVERLIQAFESETSSQTFRPILSAMTLPPRSTSKPFQGTTRFVVQRQLGAGAFGSVYQVWDREQRVALAAKVLHDSDADVLLRFKREFRFAVELRHENLVRLHELFSEDHQWFFTMELVDGETFLEYVRPGTGGCDIDRLRSALAQLAAGILYLHSAKCLHRDLKPANVLVTPNRRVVLLDFGLIRDLNISVIQSMTFAGTPAYMSPEQSMQKSLTESSDWYSVGVMLFQALTGKLPHNHFSVETLKRRDREWIAAAELNDAPADLRDLCTQLLAFDPLDRPSGEKISSSLCASEPSVHIIRDNAPGAFSSQNEFFVGREEQLYELDESFMATREGKLRVVLIDGPSGIGKTATVRHFLKYQTAKHPNILVLRGRCYEFESVPYKGLDALVDELTQYLARLPESQVNALLPRQASLLPRLFPVLGRVSAIKKAPIGSALVPDEQELRQRTFSALRELLGRLSDRGPVIIWIDDLQWGDRDSSTFLAELCAPPDQPPLLLILTYRSEDVSVNPTLQYFRRILAGQKNLGEWRQITLPNLTQRESSALVSDLIANRPAIRPEIQSQIVQEADGHPLFLQQLAYRASSKLALRVENASEFSLRTILQQRVGDLPAFAREVLEYSCIGGQPLSTQLLFEAAATSPLAKDADRGDALILLVHERLLRISGPHENRRMEPYHDQIRNAVIEMLDDNVRRTRHARLAQVLSTQPDLEPQILVKHFQEAGDMTAAYHAAGQAAAAAEQQLAFDRAALFYQVALRTCPTDGDLEALYRRLGDALAKAGSGHDAAQAYLAAAERNQVISFELRQLAASQLMRSGYVDDALALINELAHKCGVKTVKSPLGALIRMTLGRMHTRLVFLNGPPRLKGGIPSRRGLQRLALLRTAGVELMMADPVQSIYFQVKYIQEAVKHGDKAHLAAAFALEATIRVSTGYSPAAFTLLDAAEALAGDSGNANALGQIYLARAYVDQLLGRVPDGIAHAERAITFLREKCTGVAWELTAAYTLLFGNLCWSGRVSTVQTLLPQLIKEGTARGDVNVEVSLRLISQTHYAYLSADKPEECLRELGLGVRRLSNKGFLMPQLGALFMKVETYLYMGQYRKAREELVREWSAMSKSFILRTRKNLTISAIFLRGRVGLSCWLDDRTNILLQREVEGCAKQLKRIKFAWARPLSNILYAGLAVGRGLRSQAIELLQTAYEGLDEIELHGLASAARHVAGTLRDDEPGGALIRQAADFFESENVRDPASFVRMLLPGRWT